MHCRYLLLLGLSALVHAGQFTPAHDEFSINDELKLECLNDKDKWISPTCVETQKPLSLYYGRDGPLQCSVKSDDPFHTTMLLALAHSKPLHCRVPASKLAYPKFTTIYLPIDGVPVRNTKKKRISGNFNAVFHGQQGNIITGAVYSVGHSLPETVAGVTTLQFNQKWYEGSGLSVLMANKRHEEEFIIQPVVALMFCLLTACLVYVAGRVYVEGTVIPRAIKMHEIQKNESKKTQ
ncbi:hypothetical protein BX070DRAFT_218984 [Coemansia spiralis]|nr:hypothetical protein BX070DRAFT_218984 [Coemansia spiralis]